MSVAGQPAQPPDDATFYASLGRAVQVLRVHQGVSRRQLAEASGVSYTYLAEIENGKKRLSARALLYVSRGLGVRPYEILSLAESWADGDEDREKAGQATASTEPPSVAEALWMLSQLPEGDARIVAAMIDRLYRANPGRIPDSVSGRSQPSR